MWRPPGTRAPSRALRRGCRAARSPAGRGAWPRRVPAPGSPVPRRPRRSPWGRGRGTLPAGRPASRSVRENALQAELGLGERRLQLGELVAVAEADVLRHAEVFPRHEQHAVLGADPLHDVQRTDSLAVLHEADGAGLGRVPAERVAEALEPLLEDRIVGIEDAAGAPGVLFPPPPRPRGAGPVVSGGRPARGGGGGAVPP